MFNLKNVYGVLSFSRTRINLLVVERSTTGKNNCLFYDFVDLDYLTETNEFKNREVLVDKIVHLLTKADKFIGIVVKRYIFNVTYLPIRVVKNISKDFSIDENKTLEMYDYLTFIKNVNFLDDSTNETILDIHPSLWTIDGKNCSEFPFKASGKSINFEYVAYVTSSKMYQEFLNLAFDCKIAMLSLTNNQIAYCGNLEKINNQKKNVVININSDSSTINFYDERNQLIYFEKIDLGSNWMVDKIRSQFMIPDFVKIVPIIDSLESISLVDSSISIVNIHKDSFLNIKVATVGALNNYIKYVNNKFMETFNNRITNISSRTRLTYDNLFICGNNMATKLLDQSKDIVYEKFANDVIGIEDKNLVNLLGAIEYTYATQKTRDMIQYSIDPYISQNVYSSQLRKEILIKVGIVTTKWAAKLGG